MRAPLLALTAPLALFALSCQPNPLCKSSEDCGDDRVCLPIRACALECTASASCGPGMKCSAAGGCVPEAGCGDNVDCGGQLVCGEDAACTQSCVLTGCPAGKRCAAAGRCVTDTPGQASSCGGERFEATAVQANFLIVLDHSCSMADEVNDVKKWDAAVSALESITAQHQAKIRFGLQMFSHRSPSCSPGKVDVPIGDNTADAIVAALPATADGRSTPIGGALQVAAQNPGLADPDRSNNVLLVTDGKENCSGAPVAETKKLFSSGIKTFVLGFGGEVDGQMLSSMATEGGTARVGTRKYFQADDAAALTTALQAIAQGALGCDLRLDQVPPDPSKVFVYVDGAQQPRDPTKQNGWEYLSAGNRVTLFGATCSLLTTRPSAKVSIVYGCPDGSLVEGGPGSSCTANTQCASGRCQDGLCEGSPTNKPEGAPCVGHGECLSGQCTRGLCEGGGAGKQPGEMCVTHSECASQVCFEGTCTSIIN